MTFLVPVWLILLAAPESPVGPEERLVQWGLNRRDATLELHPEGKEIGRVFIEREEIFPEANPKMFDVLHVKTRDDVVRREVLLKPGDVWDSQRALETERNLRNLFYLSVAKVVPIQSSDGRIDVLVVTQDKWSLRLNNSFTLIGSLLQFLQLTLVEVNFNGWGQRLSLDTVLRLDTFSIGQSFFERRLFGSRWRLSESANIILNRRTGAPEGSTGSVQGGYPIISLEPAWGFWLEAAWNVRTRRQFRGSSVWMLPYPDENGTERIPFQYRVQELGFEAQLSRRTGDRVKADFSLSAGSYLRRYVPSAESKLTDEQATWLTANYLPRSEDAAYLEAVATLFTNDFRVLKNIDSFVLSEDQQLGFRLTSGVRWAFPSPITTQQFVEVGLAGRYKAYFIDDLFSVAVSGGARFRPGLNTVNQRLAAELLNYSPQFLGGRLVSRFLIDARWNDLNNRQSFLGGSQGLRGAFPEQFTGRNLFLSNIEYRTGPLKFLLGTYLGFVLFYDVGSAFDLVPTFQHTAGLGFRLLLPYFNSIVLRFDFGVHLNPGAPAPGLDRLNATWDQVNEIRPEILDRALP